jgi:hypothetical protein
VVEGEGWRCVRPWRRAEGLDVEAMVGLVIGWVNGGCGVESRPVLTGESWAWTSAESSFVGAWLGCCVAVFGVADP